MTCPILLSWTNWNKNIIASMNINSSQPINSNQLHPFQGPEGRKDEFQEEVYGSEACSSSARYGSRTRPMRNLKANKTRPCQACVGLFCCPLPLQSPEALLHSHTAEISAMFNHSQDWENISGGFIYLSIYLSPPSVTQQTPVSF